MYQYRNDMYQYVHLCIYTFWSKIMIFVTAKHCIMQALQVSIHEANASIHALLVPIKLKVFTWGDVVAIVSIHQGWESVHLTKNVDLAYLWLFKHLSLVRNKGKWIHTYPFGFVNALRCLCGGPDTIRCLQLF